MLIAPHTPPPRPLGHPRTTNLRSVVDSLFHISATGCRWRMLPKDFPPYSTMQNNFYPWLRHLFAVGAQAGEKLEAALSKLGKWTIEIVPRSKSAKVFGAFLRRWMVERTLAWLFRNRCLA